MVSAVKLVITATLFRFALTDEQKAAIIFSNEREIAKKKNSSKKLKNYQYLTIEFQGEVSWKNEPQVATVLSILASLISAISKRSGANSDTNFK